MKQIEKDKGIVVEAGSSVVRGAGPAVEKLAASAQGTVTVPMLTRYEGRADLPQTDGTKLSAAVRLVIRPGDVESQRAAMTVLPAARVLATG